MDTQMLMLYILILINQIISYGLLFYLAMFGFKEPVSNLKKASKQIAKESREKKEIAEERSETSGKYLDYINKFEVEA